MDHIKEAIEWTRACAYLTFRRYRPLWRAMWVPRAAGTKVAREALLDFWNVYLASTQQGRLSTAQWTNQVKMAASDLTRSWHTEARGFTDLLDWFHGYFINEETVRLWRLWAVVFHKLAREDRHGRPSSDSSHIYLIVQRGVARAWRNEATIDVLAGSCEAKSPDPIERTILRRQPRFVHNICAACPAFLMPRGRGKLGLSSNHYSRKPTDGHFWFGHGRSLRPIMRTLRRSNFPSGDGIGQHKKAELVRDLQLL
jgi:hypothetical protein